MNKTVILHYYNESYLLPFWLSHHVNMFDDGILIDYHSNDNSLSIINKYAPHWKVFTTKNDHFDAFNVDYEVMKYEELCTDWKIVLNVTEFIVGNLKDALINLPFDCKGIEIPCKIMVDLNPEYEPNYQYSLIDQKNDGLLENSLFYHLGESKKPFRDLLFRAKKLRKTRVYSRLLHRNRIGAYGLGRHTWYCESVTTKELLIYKYKYSPWNANMINRKLQIGDKLSTFDKKHHLGSQHLLNKTKLEKKYRRLKKLTETHNLYRYIVSKLNF